MPQRFGLYEDLTIDENLTLRARLYDVPTRAAVERAQPAARAGRARSPFRARLAGALSGGMKQKLALASALLTQPELLLLDEPTTGVDPLSRREFWKLLHQLHHEGLTIVVSTPYMDEAEYASRIGFLDRGQLVAVGTREEIVGAYAASWSRSARRTACRRARASRRCRASTMCRCSAPPARARRGRSGRAGLVDACAQALGDLVAPGDVGGDRARRSKTCSSCRASARE